MKAERTNQWGHRTNQWGHRTFRSFARDGPKGPRTRCFRVFRSLPSLEARVKAQPRFRSSIGQTTRLLLGQIEYLQVVNLTRFDVDAQIDGIS
jgi:hypothetical protein